MELGTGARVALLVGGAVFAAQGLLLTGGADVSHPVGHAAFVWGYVGTALALWLVRRPAARALGDLGTVGVLLAVAAAGFAVVGAAVVVVAEGLLGGTTPSLLHAPLEAGTFLVYPALGAAGTALVRHRPQRLLGALLLAGTVLDVVVAPWAFGAVAVAAALVAGARPVPARRPLPLT